MNRTDKFFYVAGWILCAILTGISILQKYGLFSLTDIGATCSFRKITGRSCPGCGGTRAVMALAEGHLLECFRFHPLVFYTALCFAFFLAWNTLALMGKRAHPIRIRSFQKIPYFHFHIFYVYAGIGILFLQWIVKLAFYPG